MKKFCCCCTTRTGALVIGTLEWIFTLMQLIAGVNPQQRAYEEKMQLQVFRNVYGNSNHQTNNYNFYNNIYSKVGYGIVAFLISLLLIKGIYKKDKRYILPWLVLKGFQGTLISICAVIIFVFACKYAHGILFAFFFLVLFIAVLDWYFWVCVWSHYKDLKEEPVFNVVAYSTANCPPSQYMEKQQNMA